MRCASLAIGERLFALSLCAMAASCGELRPRVGDQRCAEFESAIQPVLSKNCVDCHGPARADGDYRADTREHAIERAADGSPRVSGGVDSPFMKAVRGELTSHTALDAADQKALREWAVDCKAGPGPIKWHPRGWITPGDESFHGLFLRKNAYQVVSPADDRTQGCTGCHGDDLDGGASQTSCQTCHGKDVFACKTCHGTATNAAPPKSLSGATLTTVIGVGAHQSHVQDGPLHLAFKCDVCHVTPKTVWDDGHFQNAGQPEDGIAEVVMHRDGGTVVWNREDATCTNTACHAPMADSAATNQKPTWTRVKQQQADCGTCHGNPPASHSSEKDCGLCHQAAFVDGGVVRALHLDGIIEVGRPGETATTLSCTSCHGDAASFRDTHGNTDPTLVTVGAHEAHLHPRYNLTHTIGCGDCHQVPTEVRSPGHIDAPGPAVVFPPAATFPHLDNATAVWDRSNATCTNVYCHGGGSRGAMDTSPSKVSPMVWTGATSGQVYCGSCHGIPPSTAIHVGNASLPGCATCHGATMTTSGGLKTSIGPDGGVQTTHLNGIVETGP